MKFVQHINHISVENLVQIRAWVATQSGEKTIKKTDAKIVSASLLKAAAAIIGSYI
jgi:hypothetical protein